MSLTIIPGDQLDQITLIMDDILANQGRSVKYFKDKYNLSMEEYDMIYELCMPKVRKKLPGDYYRVQYCDLVKSLREKAKGDRSSFATWVKTRLYKANSENYRHPTVEDGYEEEEGE